MPGPNPYVNRQHRIHLDAIGRLVPIDYAAKLLGEPYSTVDSRIRRAGVVVFEINGVRFITRDDVAFLQGVAG